jgi:HEAT repeat protein
MARASGALLPGLLVLTLSMMSFSSEAARVPQVLPREVETEILRHGSGDFSTLIQKWKKSRSRPGLPGLLLELAQKENLSDKARAIALIGASELATEASEVKKAQEVASRQLQDRRWLVRLYAIRALEKCGAAGKANLLASRLDDSSLMVRAEAAEALYRLALQNPKEGTRQVRDRLIRAVNTSSNYSGNRPLWVPERALAVLGELRARSVLQELVKRFEREKKSNLVLHARRALDRASAPALR